MNSVVHGAQSTHVAPVHSLSEFSSQRQSTVNLSLHAADPSRSSNSFLYKHSENASSTAVSGVFVPSSHRFLLLFLNKIVFYPIH